MIFIFLSFLLFSQNVTKVLTDFKETTLRDFYYNDQFGSFFEKSVTDGVLKLKYKIKAGGYAGWGILLDDGNISQFENLIIKYQGKNAQLGIKDKSGKEEKISIPDSDIWTEFKIPFRRFKKINLEDVENINLSFIKGEGEFYVDKVFLERSFKKNNVFIDGFNKPNAYLNYYQRTSGEATVSLETSRKSKEGTYSLKISYYVKTDPLENSYVEIFWEGDKKLNWENVQRISIWIKGDGSSSYIKFRVEDGDGEIWEARNDEILKSFTWEKWDIKMSDLSLYGRKVNGVFNKEKIRTFMWIIGNKNTRSLEYAVGEVYLDGFEASGKELKEDEVTPFILRKYLFPSPLNWKGEINNEYFWTPEEKSKISHYLNLKLDATLHRNWYVEAEMATESQNFGSSSAWDGEYLQVTNPYFNSPKVSVVGKNVNKILEEINIGNIWIDYGDYLFYPRWGFKGISFVGKIDNFLKWDYFYIKGVYNSYSQGARGESYYKGYKIGIKAVSNRDTAKYAFSSTEYKIGEISRDFGYIFFLEKSFLKNNREIAYLKFESGRDISKEYATSDNSDIYNPLYNVSLDSPTIRDNLFKAYLNLNLFDNLKLNFYFRQIGRNFLPKFRWDPDYFSDVLGNQKGYNTSIRYTILNTDFLYEYDWINRMGVSSDYRKINKAELSYIGIPYFNISYRKEWKEDKNTELSKNEKDEVSRIFLRKDFKNFYFLCAFERQDISHLSTNKKYKTDIMEFETRYYFTSSIVLEGKYVKTRYGKKEWEQIGYPFSDNYLKVNLIFRF